jgi:PAS domain S-box-containing protein
METTFQGKAVNMNDYNVWLRLKERALDSTAEGVVISDFTQPGIPIIYVNNAFTRMTGYAYDEVVGKNCRFLQGDESDPVAREKIRTAIAQEQPCTVEILNYQKDGTKFWNRLSLTPVKDDSGKTTHYIGIQTDVTRRRLAEESLRTVNTQLKNDLRAAAAIQQSLLPKVLPDAPGFRFGWRYRPCQELAGDTLNITRLDDKYIVIYVLDVTGHGVSAALQSFSLAQDLRPRQGGPDLFSPKALFNRLNAKYPMHMDTGIFFTILYGLLNTSSGEFTYAAAGHPGPVLMKKAEPPRILPTHSYPIGVHPDANYVEEKIQLESGDKLILYTDGVVEALSARDIPYGEDRFLKMLKRNETQSINQCMDAVMKAMENWACHVALRDDLSLVGIEAV